jgi:hypothetical protein
LAKLLRDWPPVRITGLQFSTKNEQLQQHSNVYNALKPTPHIVIMRENHARHKAGVAASS